MASELGGQVHLSGGMRSIRTRSGLHSRLDTRLDALFSIMRRSSHHRRAERARDMSTGTTATIPKPKRTVMPPPVLRVRFRNGRSAEPRELLVAVGFPL
jgi:hypothetical protein